MEYCLIELSWIILGVAAVFVMKLSSGALELIVCFASYSTQLVFGGPSTFHCGREGRARGDPRIHIRQAVGYAWLEKAGAPLRFDC